MDNVLGSWHVSVCLISGPTKTFGPIQTFVSSHAARLVR